VKACLYCMKNGRLCGGFSGPCSLGVSLETYRQTLDFLGRNVFESNCSWSISGSEAWADLGVLPSGSIEDLSPQFCWT
jgi:hypothetical protein